MFNILVYHCTAEKNRLNKLTYMSGLTINFMGTFKDAVDLLNPVVVISLDDISPAQPSDFCNGYYNYCFIGQLQKYYFIEDVVILTNNMVEFHLQIDVLMSYRNSLLDLNVFCIKNEYNFNRMLPDSSLPTTLKPDIEYIYSSDAGSFYRYGVNIGLDTYCFVITMLNSSLPGNSFLTNSNKMTCSLVCSIRNIDDIFNSFLNYDFTNTQGLFNVDDPSQNVIKVSMFPMSLEEYIDTDLYTETGEIYVGNKSYLVYSYYDDAWHNSSGHAVSPFKLLKRTPQINVYCGKFDLRSYGSDFYNYSGHSYLSIYIPYVGFKQLNVDLCAGRVLYVWCSLDIITQTSCVVVKAGDDYNYTPPFNNNDLILVTTEPVELFYEIPLGKTNASAKATDALMLGVKTALAVGLSVYTGGSTGALIAASTALDLASRKPSRETGRVSRKEGNIIRARGALKQKENAVDTVTSSINIASTSTLDIIKSLQENTTVRGEYGGGYIDSGITVNDLYPNYTHFMLCYQKPHITIFDSQDFEKQYNHLCGRVSDYHGRLGGLYGYTELGGFHLDGIGGTLAEKNLLDEILRSGFIMPDPPRP